MVKKLYSIRAKIIVKKFRTGKQNDLHIGLSIIEFFLDIYERIKYRKFFKHLSEMGKAGEKAGKRMAGLLKEVEKINASNN